MSLLTRAKQRLADTRSMRKKAKESGNSMMVVIMLAPVVFAAFGASVDLSLGQYTNATLQSALDTATQVTLSQARNPGGNSGTNVTPYLSQDEARTLVYRQYDLNRTNPRNENALPTLICQTTATNGQLRQGPTGCAWTEQAFSFGITVRTLEVNVQVYEESAPVFLQMAGVERIQYTIESTARTTFTTG